MNWRALLLAMLVSASPACAPVAARLPPGPGVPARDLTHREYDDAAPLEGARRVCEHLESMSALVRLSGTVRGRQVRRELWIGTNRYADVRFESSTDSTRAPFTLWASHDVSRLYFPQSNQLVESTTPDGLIEAVWGLPVGLADFPKLTMGCPEIQSEIKIWQLQEGWLRVSHEQEQWYLHRASDTRPWSLVAIDHHEAGAPFGWRARFLEKLPDDTSPRRLRITSLDGNGAEGARFDVHLMFSAFQQWPSQPFTEEGIWIPVSARRTAFEDVKQQWPLVALTQPR